MDKIICLGDIIAKGIHPQECIKLIKERCDIVIQGNTDEYFSNKYENMSDLPEQEQKRIKWNHSLITEEDREYLLNLPFSYEFYMSGSLVRLFHATDKANNKVVLNIDDIETKYEMFLPSEYTKSNNVADVVIYGHIHHSYMDKIYNKTLINVGSVGNIGIVVVFAITYFNPQTGSGANIDITSLNLGLALYVFVAGMIAISAMILPGISGSTLLLIFGLYMPIITGIKETLHFNLSYIPVLFVFGLGVIAGIALIVRVVKKALEKYRAQTIYLIIGLMIGSIYAIVMGATTLKVLQAPLSLKTFNFIYFAIGGLIILGMEVAKRKSENKE